jgi:hypothetical protein
MIKVNMDDPLTIPISRSTTAKPSVSQPTTAHKYQTEVIDLPSKGYFYSVDDPLSSGQVELKMMTAKEEDILTSDNLIKKGIVLDKLLDSLIIDKNIKSENLLTGDKNALFVAARRLAYGNSYGPVKIKCKSCGEETDTVVDLSEIHEKDYDFTNKKKGKNAFEFTLPYAKRNVVIKIITSKDETDIDGELKSINKITKNSSEVTTRLKYIIIAVDGETDKGYIRNFVDNELLSRDSIELRKYIRDLTPDLDMNFNFTCGSCQATERIGVPMTVQFFWPESRV